MLPNDFPKWQPVYYYFSRWKEDGTFEEIHENLRDKCREQQGKRRSPGVGLTDSQSMKTTRADGISRGVDGGKKVMGRKRHIITDAGGLLLTAEIHAANESDGKAEFRVIKTLSGRFERKKKLYTGGGYRGEQEEKVKKRLRMGYGNHPALEPVNRISATAQTMDGRKNLFMAGKFSQAVQRLQI
jgi:putative transposase